MGSQYTSLARFYEKILFDKNYDSWTDYVVSLLKSQTTSKNGLDVACGSGILTRKLKKQGFSVVGIDVSEDMLFEAQRIANEENLSIKFLKQDMRNLKSFEKVGFITVINDGINYVNQSDIEKTFKRFYTALNSQGVLIFDVSSEYKLKNVLSNNVFCDNSEDVSYIWFNELDESKNLVNIDLTIFEKNNDSYIRYDESQTQYIHDINSIVNALNSAGFKSVKTLDKFGNELQKDSDRILFIAKK